MGAHAVTAIGLPAAIRHVDGAGETLIADGFGDELDKPGRRGRLTQVDIAEAEIGAFLAGIRMGRSTDR
jgi:hypothetical protein